MSDVINSIFNSITSEFVSPIGDGLVSVIPWAWAIAFFVAIASLIFGFFGNQKGPKIVVVLSLALFGFVWFTHGTWFISELTNGQVVMEQNESVTLGNGSSDTSSGNSSSNEESKSVREQAAEF